jgi:aldose 1-epimerase
VAATANARLYRIQHVDPAGTTLAVVVPEWGANVIGFSYHPAELRWPVPFLEPVDLAAVAAKPTSYGIPVLAPTPGRVGRERGGVFRYRGAEYRLAHAQHGFVRHLPWNVLAHTPAAISCGLAVHPTDSPDSFPFEFEVEQRIEIAERRLDMRIVFRNTSHRLQPISVGWHPYLHRQPTCRVRVPAARLWQLDDRAKPTPTGALVPVTGASDFRHARTLGPDEVWDETFTALTAENGVASCWVEDEPLLVGCDDQLVAAIVRRTVEVSPQDGASCGLRHIQLYTPPGRPAIAVEPFSSPPNALNLLAEGVSHVDVRELAPGEEASFQMALGLSVQLGARGSG